MLVLCSTLLALLLHAAWLRPSFNVAASDPRIADYLLRFHEREASDEQVYYWSRERFAVVLDGFWSRPALLEVRLASPRPPGARPAELRMVRDQWETAPTDEVRELAAAGNKDVQRLLAQWEQTAWVVRGDWRRYHVLVPPGDDGTQQVWFQAQTFRPPGEKRHLGVALSHIKATVPAPVRWTLPGIGWLLLVLPLPVLAFMLVRWLVASVPGRWSGFAPGVALACAGAAIAAVVLATAYPLRWGIALTLLVWGVLALGGVRVLVGARTMRREVWSRLVLVGVSTVLTLVLIGVPFELLLRSDVSQLHLFGVFGSTYPLPPQGSYPKQLQPTFNSRLYRDSKHALEKPPGTFRVLILGDSYTFGSWVADDDIYPRLLQEMAGPQVEIITMAQQGWNTRDHVAALLREGLAYEPDMVVVGVVFNDPVITGVTRPQDPPWQVFTRITDRLLVFRFLDSQISAIGGLPWLRLRYSTTAARDGMYTNAYAWELWQDAVHRLGDTLQSRGIPGYAFVLVSPTGPQPGTTVPMSEKYRLLAQEFAAAGFHTVNLEAAFQAEFGEVPYKQLWALPNDGHPNATLQAFYAREIWGVIESEVTARDHGRREQTGCSAKCAISSAHRP